MTTPTRRSFLSSLGTMVAALIAASFTVRGSSTPLQVPLPPPNSLLVGDVDVHRYPGVPRRALPEVKVKGLIWESQTGMRSDERKWKAIISKELYYRIDDTGKTGFIISNFRWVVIGDRYPTLEAAKVAAQEHWNATVLGALHLEDVRLDGKVSL